MSSAIGIEPGVPGSQSETINTLKTFSVLRNELHAPNKVRIAFGQFVKHICFLPIRYMRTHSEHRLNFDSFGACFKTGTTYNNY